MEQYTKLHDQMRTLEQRALRLKEELDVLLDLVAVIGKSVNFENAVKSILDGAKQVIPFDTAALQRLEGDTLHVIGGSGFLNNDEIKKLRFPFPEEGVSAPTPSPRVNLCFHVM